MIYAAFTLWLFLILFAGVGVYRLWTMMVKPAYVHWALLPGTLVSEMAYIFGCLITGGEIRRAKIIEMPGGKGKGGEPTTDAAPGIKIIGPLLASLLAMVACIAAILLARKLLGASIIDTFASRHGAFARAVPQTLPGSWDQIWAQLGGQLVLLQQTCETFASSGWLTLRGVLFIYLAICLSVRLSPVTRPMRPTLAAVVVIAGIIAVVGLIWRRFGSLMEDIWPLVTYVWGLLLFLLALTLFVRGIFALVRILAGKAR